MANKKLESEEHRKVGICVSLPLAHIRDMRAKADELRKPFAVLVQEALEKQYNLKPLTKAAKN